MAVSSDHASTVPKARPWWGVVTSLLLAAVFLEAVFAGALLSGYGWALAAHGATAGILIASATVAALVALATLRRVPGGWKLGLTLSALAVLLVAQAAVGMLTEKGTNLLWLHVPLGVGLFGLARQAVADAGRLNGG
jgi:hypothetical protein